jgi:hypothetical protein
MTGAYFFALVDAFVDEMSAKCAAEIEKEAKDGPDWLLDAPL